jgi:mannose-6-phosphate isomerase
MSAKAPQPVRPVRPTPFPSPRPWAGHRLGGPGAGIGELWLAGPQSIVEGGAGPLTLDAIAAVGGSSFVGERAMRLLGPRFPLIVKLIDAADWLSLQVHPDDALAAELFGGLSVGKAEAWLVLDADVDTELVTGPGRQLGEAALRDRIAAGTLGLDDCEVRRAVPGETLLLEPGTLHAIGAGAFVYEIEQPSDITFRISDWGRPPVPGRVLHWAEALRAIRPGARAILAGHDWRVDDGSLAVRQFRLEVETPGRDSGRVTRRPDGASLEVVTVIAGSVDVTGDGWREHLGRYDTLVVPASIDAYEIDGPEGARVCVGSIP